MKASYEFIIYQTYQDKIRGNNQELSNPNQHGSRSIITTICQLRHIDCLADSPLASIFRGNILRIYFLSLISCRLKGKNAAYRL